VAAKQSGGNHSEDDPCDGDPKATIEDVVAGLRIADTRMNAIERRLEEIEATEPGSRGDPPRS
jgi:hypothetical protein